MAKKKHWNVWMEFPRVSKTFAKLSTPSDLSNEGRKELEVLKVGVNLAVFLRPFYFLRLENYPNRKLIHTQLHYSCNKDCRCGINTILNNSLNWAKLSSIHIRPARKPAITKPRLFWAALIIEPFRPPFHITFFNLCICFTLGRLLRSRVNLKEPAFEEPRQFVSH